MNKKQNIQQFLCVIQDKASLTPTMKLINPALFQSKRGFIMFISSPLQKLSSKSIGSGSGIPPRGGVALLYTALFPMCKLQKSIWDTRIDLYKKSVVGQMVGQVNFA